MKIDVDKYNTFVDEFFAKNEKLLRGDLEKIRAKNQTEEPNLLDALKLQTETMMYLFTSVNPSLIRVILENLDDLTEKP
ncbi:MAG: hypothetical protein WCP79_06930 [Bacillota bacterium]